MTSAWKRGERELWDLKQVVNESTNFDDGAHYQSFLFVAWFPLLVCIIMKIALTTVPLRVTRSEMRRLNVVFSAMSSIVLKIN